MNPSTPTTKRSPLKIILWILFAFFVFVITSIAFLPTLLSSSWGKEKLTSIINQSIPGTVKIDNLSLSWTGSQKIEGVSLTDPQNNTVLSLDSASTNTSFFGVLLHPLSMASFEVKGLNATLVGDSEGNTNLMRALNKNCCQINKMREGTPLMISLKDAQGNLNLTPQNGIVTFQLTGLTEQNAIKGQFSIDAELNGVDFNEISKGENKLEDILSANSSGNVKLNADISNFPVELIDQIVSIRSPKFSGLLKEILGNKLDVKIDQKSTEKGIALNIRANSPSLSANADVILNSELILANPAEISLNVLPEASEKLLALLNINSPFRLASPTKAKISITNLQVPAGNYQKVDESFLEAIGLNATLNVSQAELIDSNNNNRLIVKGLQATVVAEPHTENASIKITSEAMQEDKPTKINLDLKIPKKILLQNTQNFSLKDTSLNGTVEGIPVSILDQYAHSPLTASMIAGPYADLAFSLQKQDNKSLATVQLKSERLTIPQMSFWLDKNITLQKPVQIVLNLNNRLVNEILQDTGSQMQGPATIQLLLNSFSAPLSHLTSSLNMIYKVDLDAQLKITSLRLTNVPKIGGVSLNDFSARLLSKSKSRPELSASFSLQPDGQSTLSAIAGEKIAFKTDASLGIGLDGKLTANVFNIEINSDLARVELSGEIQDGNRFVLNAPAMLSYTFTSAGLQSMGIAADNYLFEHDAPLEMTIDSSHIPTSLNDLALLKLSGKLKVNDLKLMSNNNPKSSLAIVDNISADWSVDGASKLMTLDFTGITRLGENLAAGKVNGSLRIDKWIENGALNFNRAGVRVHANCSKLPTEFITVFSGQKYLVPLLGNALDLTVDVNGSMAQTDNGTVSIDINSENLSGGFGLSLGDIIQLSKKRPAEFTLKLTPQGYAAIRRQINENSAGNFILTEPAIATLKLQAAQFPRSQSLLLSGIQGEFSIGRLIGMDTQTKSKITLNSVQGNLSSQNLLERIDFNLNAKGHTDEVNQTAWNMAGAMSNGFQSDGSINRQDLSMSLDATVEALPIPLLCQFACVDPKLKQKIEIVFGPRIDAKVKTILQHMNGPLFVEINGANAKFTVDSYLNQGILTLNQDLTAQMAVTPQLGEYVLKDLIPVLSGMLSADHPVNLTISKEGFALPLRNPSVANVSIGGAVLEMGKVHFSGESQIAKVLDLLTPASSTQLVWLTPAYFSLNQGVLQLYRVDMLISDRYPIAAWGDVDFGKDRVNMVIGLSGSAISKAFSVPKISNEYFLQLPLKGRLSSPSIDRTRAAARISALVAQSQGGAEGLVLGTVLDIASGGLSESQVPPPTTNPLPWAHLMQDSSASDVPQDGERKKMPNPIKDLEKGASSLFKKIFK